MSKLIPLTQGKFAIVDDEDYEKLSKYNWCAVRNGQTYYAVRQIKKGKRFHCKKNSYKWKTIYMHRQILGLSPDFITDHKNNNGLDNRKNNLRICNQKQNMHNQSKQKRHKSSIYKGVSYSHCKNDRNLKKWVVHIGLNGRSQFIGRFHNEIKAAQAYDKKAKELFGEFAHINF